MSKIETMFKWNDAEYDFDIHDADNAEKLEKAMAALQADEDASPKDGSPSKLLRYQCGMLRKVFDTCFVEGAGKAVCGEKDNFLACIEAYREFLTFISRQKEQMTEYTNTFSLYSNRTQRRAAKKQ